MRVLVTGRHGQVARSLAERPPTGTELIFAARPGLDLSDAASIDRVVAATAPDLIVSAAAYTAVDRAEAEPDVAMAINGEAPGILARAAAQCGARILHLSTDYVFAGDLDHPYVESDVAGPVGTYGRTKLAGEDAVRTSAADHIILRTSWVYSPFGTNFVRTMLRVGGEREEVSVVEDQRGCPTSAHDIADAIGAAVANWRTGTFHFAGRGQTVWADFARVIFDESGRLGGPSAKVRGIPTSAYPTEAARPMNSQLDSSLFKRTFGHAAPHWRSSLRPVVERLLR